ncbi:MAG: EamA family transporter [Clostridiales bacterium]|nr:EamA family transporter [Clostridiales bacterium]
MFNKKYTAVGIAILAAVLYGINAPFAKMLLEEIPVLLLASLMYLGAGAGMLLINIVKVIKKHESREARITKKELPSVIGMILLDIAAPILLMLGLSLTNAANVSLLNNFEIVATTLIALLIYKETVGKRMWLALFLIIIASFVLSIENFSSFSVSLGSLFVIFACICWGFENNLTRILSEKDPMQVVVIKGFGSGFGALLIAFFAGAFGGRFLYIIFALLLGFIAYGLSIFFYVTAQRDLGAARTSIYYAAAPFVGVLASWIVLKESVSISFIVALVIMIIGTYLAVSEKHRHTHIHNPLEHDHRHSHNDGHHNHFHSDLNGNEHSHKHLHEEVEHKHSHTPDLHHKHRH